MTTLKKEYREGEDARKRFNAAMESLFRAPKTVSMSSKKKRKPRASASGRASGAKPTSD